VRAPLSEAAEEIEREHDIEREPIPADLTDRDETVALVESVVDRFGGIDILVNNAGKAVAGSLDELLESAFEERRDELDDVYGWE